MHYDPTCKRSVCVDVLGWNMMSQHGNHDVLHTANTSVMRYDDVLHTSVMCCDTVDAL